jgi:hypothetical protein
MRQYLLYKISAWSLFKIGFLIGSIASFLPIAIVALLFFRIVSGLAGWLGGLVYRIELPLPGNFGFDINVVELLKLQQAYDWLVQWAAVGAIPLMLLILLVTVLLGLFWGMIAALGAFVFNLLSRIIGGIQLSLSEVALQPQVATKTTPASQPTGDRDETKGVTYD